MLITLEGLSLVLARTAILDVFLQFFIVASFAALVVDRDKMRERLGRLIADGADLAAGSPSLGPRPWRPGSPGSCIGLACAVKWTASSFFLVFVVLTLLWDRGALRAAGVRHPTRVDAAPLGIARHRLVDHYAVRDVPHDLHFIGWFAGENGWGRHWADTHSTHTRLNLPFGIHIPFDWGWLPSPIRDLGAYTLDAYRFHESLDSGHAYQSSPWSWLVLGRPVDFYYNGSGGMAACGPTSCSEAGASDRNAVGVVGVRADAALAGLALVPLRGTGGPQRSGSPSMRAVWTGSRTSSGRCSCSTWHRWCRSCCWG